MTDSPWKLWANPIFRRYVRSRLRPTALGVALLLTVLVAGFIFFGARTVAMFQFKLEVVDAERVPLLPLMGLQALILFFLGTGQVAGGMTAEADEGVLDYQRLTPLRPLTKVIGYLLGLPLREYVMAAATLPFTAWGLWRGEVPVVAWVSVYLALLSSTLLYHLTGLVAGTVLKNRRWAFLVSIGIVFGLYTVIPQAAKFGLTTFKYFTIWPVFEEQMGHFLPHTAGRVFRQLQEMTARAPFFGLNFSEIVFTLFSQLGLILTFVVMLWRRWRQSEAHLLGKVWAAGLMIWTQVMLLGNALPLITPGHLFPSREFRSRLFATRGWTPSITEGVAMIGLFGLVALLLVLLLTSLITPSLDGQVRGRRRARKLGLVRPSWFSDAATGFWFALAMAVTAAVGWFCFARALITSSWYDGTALAPHALAAFCLVIFSTVLAFHALLEGWGWRRLFLAIIFVGIAPLMVGMTLMAAGDRFLTVGIWILAISPLAAPILASQITLPSLDLPLPVSYAIPNAFWFWQSLAGIAAVMLVHRLWRQKNQSDKR